MLKCKHSSWNETLNSHHSGTGREAVSDGGLQTGRVQEAADGKKLMSWRQVLVLMDLSFSPETLKMFVLELWGSEGTTSVWPEVAADCKQTPSLLRRRDAGVTLHPLLNLIITGWRWRICPHHVLVSLSLWGREWRWRDVLMSVFSFYSRFQLEQWILYLFCADIVDKRCVILVVFNILDVLSRWCRLIIFDKGAFQSL